VFSSQTKGFLGDLVRFNLALRRKLKIGLISG